MSLHHILVVRQSGIALKGVLVEIRMARIADWANRRVVASCAGVGFGKRPAHIALGRFVFYGVRLDCHLVVQGEAA
jgi:hypothetical protein